MKRFKIIDGMIIDTTNDKQYYKEDVVELLNLLTETDNVWLDLLELRQKNKELKSLNHACKEGQKNLLREMKKSDQALDEIWEIMKKLYGEC